MKSGFSSLELIMAMAISAIIMTSLLEIYNQVARNMGRVERFVFEDTQVLTLKNRLGSDFAGLSAIWFTQGEVETKMLADGEKMPAPEKRKRSNYFYSVNKDKHLDTLTFVTTSALQSYGGTQDRFIRVLYQVEEDPKDEDLFRLMRKEISMPTENIDVQALKNGKFYELVHGIKSVEMMYELIDKVELQKQTKAQAKLKDGQKSSEESDPEPVLRSVKQWGAPDVKVNPDKGNEKIENLDDDEEDEKENLGGAAVPKFVKMKIVFGVTDTQVEKEYNLEFYIPSTVDNIPKGMTAIKKQKKGEPAPKGSQDTSVHTGEDKSGMSLVNNQGLS